MARTDQHLHFPSSLIPITAILVTTPAASKRVVFEPTPEARYNTFLVGTAARRMIGHSAELGALATG